MQRDLDGGDIADYFPAPNSADRSSRRRLHDFRLFLLHLVGQSPDRAGNADRADGLAGEVLDRDRHAADFEIEFAVVERDAGPPDFVDLAQQHRYFGNRLLGRRLQLHAAEEMRQLVGLQRGEDRLSECSAVGRADDADPVGQLEGARTARAGNHHHDVAHADGEMAAFAGIARQLFEHRRREVHHLDFVERAGGQCKQRSADAVTLGVFFLANIAKRHHRLGEMKRGGVVQPHPLAQIRQPNSFAVARDFLEDREGASERLNADALAVLDVVAELGPRRLHKAGDRSPDHG